MDTVILEFEDKVREIDEYFNFVKRTTHLRGFFTDSNAVQVSQSVHNILKANLFLLLYNLVESSFKKSLESICIQITNDRITYTNVIPEIRKIWISKQYKNFENACIIPREMQKSEFIMNKIDNIAQDIINIEFDNELSGNVTTSQIQKLTTQYGLQSDEISNREATSLYVIKNKRNDLAHGDETFSRCGASYTMQELKEIKNSSIDYMSFILSHIKTYLDNKRYKIEEN